MTSPINAEEVRSQEMHLPALRWPASADPAKLYGLDLATEAIQRTLLLADRQSE